MKVKMKVATYFNGAKLEVGRLVEVDPVVAARWVNAGIAEIRANKPPVDNGDEKPIEKMNTEQLKAKAAELGVDISVCTTNKQRAETIQAFLDSETPEDNGEDEENEE